MFTVYTEKEIFEEMIIFRDENPNWSTMLLNHCDVCINISDADFALELAAGKPIFEFIMANGGRSPIALKDYFDDIYKDKTKIIEKPRSAFILDINKQEADDLQKSLGVLVLSSKSIDDNILKGTYYKELQKDLVVEGGGKIGWNYLLNFNSQPSNAVVISDEYLFRNEERSQIVGQNNLLKLLNSIMPPTLDIPYHILIITQDHSRSKEWCEKMVGDLKSAIVASRPYQICLEMVFSDSIHKRKAMLNYFSLTCDKGFAMFKLSDNKTIRDDNDVRYEKIFNRLDFAEGDTEFMSSAINLKQIKSKCISVKDYINNVGADYNKRILGDCKKDKTIINRLIDDV